MQISISSCSVNKRTLWTEAAGARSSEWGCSHAGQAESLRCCPRGAAPSGTSGWLGPPAGRQRMNGVHRAGESKLFQGQGLSLQGRGAALPSPTPPFPARAGAGSHPLVYMELPPGTTALQKVTEGVGNSIRENMCCAKNNPCVMGKQSWAAAGASAGHTREGGAVLSAILHETKGKETHHRWRTVVRSHFPARNMILGVFSLLSRTLQFQRESCSSRVLIRSEARSHVTGKHPRICPLIPI